MEPSDDPALRALEALNIDIGRRESQGDTSFFESLLTPTFAMRRSNGATIDRATFIAAVSPSGRRDTTIKSVSRFGSTRALVACVVALHPTDAAAEQTTALYSNVRLFVRESVNDRWRLLAWANEPEFGEI